MPCNALLSRLLLALLRALYTCKRAPCCLLQAFAEEVTNLQKQDAGPEELQQKLVQVGAGGGGGPECNGCLSSLTTEF